MMTHTQGEGGDKGSKGAVGPPGLIGQNVRSRKLIDKITNVEFC